MDLEKTAQVVEALRKSRKGQLKYDRNWQEEGRMNEILEEMTLLRITVSPEALKVVQKSLNSPKTNGETGVKSPGVEKIAERNKVSEEVGEKRSSESSEDAHYLEQAIETELPILQYEAERQKLAQQLYDYKQEQFEKFLANLREQYEQQYNIVKERQEMQDLQKNFELQRMEQSCLKQYEEIYRKNQQEIDSLVSEAISPTKEAQAQAEKEALIKKNKEQEELKSRYEKLQDALFQQMIPKIQEKIAFCKQQNFQNLPYMEWKSTIAKSIQVFQLLMGSVASNSVTSTDIEKCDLVLKQTENLLQDISTASVSKQEERQKEMLSKSRTVSASVSPSDAPAQSQPPESDKGSIQSVKITASEKSAVNDAVSSDVSEIDSMDEDECSINQNNETSTRNENNDGAAKFIDTSAYQLYYDIMKTMKELNSTLQTFKNDPSQKKYRLMLHKAVAINTISDSSGSQLKDKIHHLVSLLSGQTVECGGKYCSTRDHQLAASYCKNLLAEKIVMQGEEQVASKTGAAFPFACVAVTICSKFPDLERLIMGHFYLKCPYLVPYYPNKEEGQSDDDYYVSLGYKFTDGKLEEKTNFLKRMHGYMGLYAAMIQSSSAPGYPGNKLFSLEHGWKWVVRVLNLDPRPDITATMLLAFLEIGGHKLLKTYDKQFKKVLHTLCKDYFLKIKQVESSGGPVGRLKEFLQIAIRKGHILEPEGTITPMFWRT